MMDDRQVMGDEQIGQAEFVAKIHHQVEDLGLDRDVERGYGLIGDDQLRTHRERPGDADALPLATGKLMRDIGLPARH